MRSLAKPVWICALLLCGPLACSKQKLIPNTKIPDTKPNRSVVKVVEAYRKAMEKKNAPRILTLVHPTYRDNSGTPNPFDDIDYQMLKKVLTTRFKRAKRVRYHIDYHKVRFRGREATVDAWVDATFIYEYPDVLPQYKRFADYQRYKLVKADGRWQFISGL